MAHNTVAANMWRAQPYNTDTADERDAKVQAAIAEGLHVAAVLAPDLTEQEHVTVEPQLRFAACSCNKAKQRQACEHQLVYLMTLTDSNDKIEADRLIVRLMGAKFDSLGGCDRDDISILTESINALHSPNGASARHDPACSAMGQLPATQTTEPEH